jgi:sortase A
MALWLSRLALVLGCLLIGLGVVYGGLVWYLAWQEETFPSTTQVLVLKDGRRIPLHQPTATPPVWPEPAAGLSPPPEAAAGTEDGSPGFGVTATPVSASLPANQAASDVPPSRITIPGLGLDWPVVLSTNEHMPRFKGVGWLLGSAYPGQAGNLVLFGHLDGPYSTFGPLHELRPGDTFHVATAAGVYQYRVRASFETTPDDVAVLAPTDGPTATLITCAGQWDKATQMYDRRLVITADLIAGER